MVKVIKSSGVTGSRITVGITLRHEEDRSYPIIIENGVMSQIPKDIKERKLGERFAIISDTNVAPIYGGKLEAALQEAGFIARLFLLRAGEENKNIVECIDIANQMSAGGFGRDTTVIALGGGVVGDMAGFIAAGFLRGVPYIQVPTTLVAQADSSIGGKTGVDTAVGKNLFGFFKQPRLVYIDPVSLKTLPSAEFACGMAETIKHAIIRDSRFFDYLENNSAKIMKLDDDALLHLSRTNCTIKGLVVEEDPEEKGKRRILNFGHTIGHAIEHLSGYELKHGECVSIGIAVASRIAWRVTGFWLTETDRIEKLLKTFRLPIKIPPNISNEQIITQTTPDKKAKNGMARYTLPIRIGEMAAYKGQYSTYVDEQTVSYALNACR